jgi:hypothetical protein
LEENIYKLFVYSIPLSITFILILILLMGQVAKTQRLRSNVVRVNASKIMD